jgi:hypothetical protein
MFFLLCLTVALLFNLPVKQVLPHVELPRTVQIAGVDGTVLKGAAAELRINNFPIRGIRYRYMPSCIAMLKVCYHIVYDQGEIQVAYDVLNGDTEVSRSEIEYPVTDLLDLLPDTVPVKPSGQLNLRVDDLSMQQDKLIAVTGKLIWRNLGLNDSGVKIDIGDYQVDFKGDPKKYDFTFSDLDADLGLSGKGSVSATGVYDLDVRIEADNGIDPQVRSVLNLVAARTSLNKYRIEQKGRVPPRLMQQLFR